MTQPTNQEIIQAWNAAAETLAPWEKREMRRASICSILPYSGLDFVWARLYNYDQGVKIHPGLK